MGKDVISITPKRVVVTGLGALTPIGNTVQAYWKGLQNGQSGAAPITRFDATDYRTQFACEVKDVDAQSLLGKKEARKMDPFSQYSLLVVDEAVRDAHLDLDALNLDRIGVIWGSGIGGLSSFQQSIEDFSEGERKPRFSPFFIPRLIPDIAAGHISIRYGFRGPNYATVSACASSTHAIYDAFTCVRYGRSDIVVTGGAEMAVCEAGIGGFNAMRALSERNDSPETASRPYDKDRDGFVLGEGAGALILEDYEHAKKRNAHIYAEVIGGGLSGDAYHVTMPHPEGLGVIRVMKNALEESAISPSEIDYINTHGTSTPLGDMAEIKAIQRLFGEHAYKMSISATKSMTGHLLGAAGAIEAIACIMAIKEGVVPPTINHFEKDKDLDPRLDLTFNKAKEKKINIALSNTFGFGGHNASIVMRKV